MAKSKRTLVILDDEPHILTALTRAFRQADIQIVTFHSAVDALSYLESHNPGVIISDEVMPIMSGAEFLKRAEKRHPYASRIMLTGYSMAHNVNDVINECNAWKYVTKPWSNDQLLKTVEMGFERYEGLTIT